jgi:hypothetical protein
VASKSTNAVDPSQGDLGDQAKQNELIHNLNEIKEEVAADPAADQEDW